MMIPAAAASGGEPSLFVPGWLWAVTVGIVVLLITFEFIQATRNPHEVQIREAAIQSVIYVAIAIAYGVFFGWWSADQTPPEGGSYGLEYFAGWLIEKSLSVDNLFVFVIIMSAFAVPKIYQQKVLMAGIAGALVLRTIFIFVGAAALEAFSATYLVFGAFLIYTAIGLARHRDEDPEFNEGKVVKLAKRILPFSDEYDGPHLHTRINGKFYGTHLLMVMIAIFATDIIFALDSIPAVYGVTNEPFIVFAANAFALLGLRALYFLVAGLLDRLVYLSLGLAVILAFIGIKLILVFFDIHIDIWVSLGFIIGILVITTVASLIKVRKDPSAVAHAGTIPGFDSSKEKKSDK
ncbi:MAG: TerC family protein [Candidatus Nanopelagicales bacterium]|nr:TerC family protein [Candidatus Nanopelagicales bacterium]